MNEYLYNFAKKVIIGGVILMTIFCAIVWWKVGYVFALTGFITGSFLFTLVWIFFKYIFKQKTFNDLSDEDQEAIKRVSSEITNSVLVCTPFDTETFNRVINDLKTIIDNNLPVRLDKHSSEEDKLKANNKLNDVYSYLSYLRMIYVKKPSNLKEINSLIDKFTWKND